MRKGGGGGCIRCPGCGVGQSYYQEFLQHHIFTFLVYSTSTKKKFPLLIIGFTNINKYYFLIVGSLGSQNFTPWNECPGKNAVEDWGKIDFQWRTSGFQYYIENGEQS